MWRSAGLHICEDGLIIPSNDPTNHRPMQDDMVSNALVWIVMKLVNFIAAGDDLPEEISPMGLGIRQKQTLEYWEGMERQLSIWYNGLPDGFRPSAMVKPASGQRSRAIESLNLPKKWFARPMCASTMQWYHFARVQLLHNKPHLSTGIRHKGVGAPTLIPGSPGSLAERHMSYAAILEQGKQHAEEIISIGLAQTDEGVRVHAVQPLYAAGQLLGISGASEQGDANESSRLRACVLNLLRDIERDTGWATDYRVRQLLDMWQLPVGWGEDDRHGYH